MSLLILASCAGKIAGVELNLACPNIPGKPTVALDFDQMASVLQTVLGHAAFAESGLPLGIKLAPYFDGPHFDLAAEIINRHKERSIYRSVYAYLSIYLSIPI